MRNNNYEERNDKKVVNGSDSKSKRSNSQNRNNKNRKFKGTNKSRKDDFRTERGSDESITNDPAFYSKYPTVLNQVGKINNYHPVGLLGKDMFGEVPNTVTVRGIPGIVAMNIIPAIPVAKSGESTLQQSAYQTWTKVRDAISGSRPYDPVDLQLMSIAVSQAVSCATWLKRFFNFAYTMSPFNRYAPERLFDAMHCNYADFIDNLPDYRAKYNRITINLSRIYANTENNYHQMLRSLFGGVLAEPGDNGQLYLYNPGGFYKFAWSTDEKGIKVGSLVFQGNDPNNRDFPIGESVITTMSVLLHDYELLVNALITDGDINTMSGDILKTYGEKAQVALPLALETDSDLPKVSLTDLAQFAMSYVPLNNSTYSNYNTIIQTDAAYITFEPKLHITDDCIPMYNYIHAEGAKKTEFLASAANQLALTTQRNRVLLNDVIDLNAPANVAEVVRNIPTIKDYSVADITALIEADTAGLGLTFDIESTTGVLPYATVIYQIDSYEVLEDIMIQNNAKVFRNFTFLPMRLIYNIKFDNGEMVDVHLDANLNDYYSVPKDQITQIHDVMALSMFSDL